MLSSRDGRDNIGAHESPVRHRPALYRDAQRDVFVEGIA
jgi:hypothetical protein